jgi:hypothetical protein
VPRFAGQVGSEDTWVLVGPGIRDDALAEQAAEVVSRVARLRRSTIEREGLQEGLSKSVLHHLGGRLPYVSGGFGSRQPTGGFRVLPELLRKLGEGIEQRTHDSSHRISQ